MEFPLLPRNGIVALVLLSLISLIDRLNLKCFPNSCFILCSRLEDTLIDLFLSGYSNLKPNAADDMTVFPETDVPLRADGLS